MSRPDESQEITDLLYEIRDLLRSIEARTARAEHGLARIWPALTTALARAMTNPRVRKLIGDKSP